MDKAHYISLFCATTSMSVLASCTGTTQRSTIRGSTAANENPSGSTGDATAAAAIDELFAKVNPEFFSQAIFKSPPHSQVPGSDFHDGLADASYQAMAAAPWALSPCNDSVPRWAFSGDGNTVTVTFGTTGDTGCRSVTVIACDEIEERDKPGPSSGVSEAGQPALYIQKWVETCIARQLAGGISHFRFKQKYVAPAEGIPSTMVRLTEGHQGNLCQVNISAANTFTYDGDCRYLEAHLSGSGTKNTDGWMSQDWARTVEYASTGWAAMSSIVAPTIFMTIPKGAVRVVYAGDDGFEINFAAPTVVDSIRHQAAWAGMDNKGHTCSGTAVMTHLPTGA